MIKKILILLTFTLNVYSQELSNRIIIWDITLSTIGLSFSGGVKKYNPDKDIFDNLKNSLIQKIKRLPDDGGSIHLLQFREEVKYNKTFKNDVFGRDELLKFVTNYDLTDIPANRGNTNIAGAWEEGMGLLDIDASNEFYLFTDGKQNVSHNGAQPKKAFYAIIKKYCERINNLKKNDGKAVSFFISINSEIEKDALDLLDECMIVIDSPDIPPIVIIKPKISLLRLNISNENLSIIQRFSADNDFVVDKFPFDVSLQIPDAPAGYLLDLKPKSYQLNKDGDVEIKTEIVAGDWKNYLKVSDTIHANLLLKSNYTKTDFIVAFANNGNLPLIIVNRPKKTVSLRKVNIGK